MLWKTLKNSFVVSIDMAHALHPNYPAKHDASMAPKINGGLVIKTNANQRYADRGCTHGLRTVYILSNRVDK
jgi:aspartyl aminopeptidase